MKYKSTVFLLAIITHFQVVNADDAYIHVFNKTVEPISVKSTSSYCIESVEPPSLQIEPGHFKKIDVDYSDKWGCGFVHSSQDFEVTFTLKSHQYRAVFEFYKKVGKDPTYSIVSDPDDILNIDESQSLIYVATKHCTD